MPVARAQTDLLCNNRPLLAGIDRGMASMQRYGASSTRILGGVTRSFGLTSLSAGALAMISFRLAREQEQAEKKLEAVLKATGGAAGYNAAQLKQMASQLQGVTNYGDEATISMMAVLGTFKEVQGPVFKEAVERIQDMSAVLGQDLQSGAIQLGKALNDPIRGITALSRVGVSFTEQQKEQIKALQEAGDMMAAQRVILAELKSEFGGAAREMADPWIQFKNAMGDLAEIIGESLLPMLKMMLPPITEAVGGMRILLKEFELLEARHPIGPGMRYGGAIGALGGPLGAPIAAGIGNLIAPGQRDEARIRRLRAELAELQGQDKAKGIEQAIAEQQARYEAFLRAHGRGPKGEAELSKWEASMRKRQAEAKRLSEVEKALYEMLEKHAARNLTNIEKQTRALKEQGATYEQILRFQQNMRQMDAFKRWAEDTKDVNQMLATMADRLRTFGMTEGELLAYRARQKGGSEDAQNALRSAADKMEAMQRIKDLETKHRSPAEQYWDTKAELERLKGFGLKEELYNQALTEARERAREALAPKEEEHRARFESLGGLYRRISAAAASDSPENRTAKAAEETARLTKENKEKLAAIEKDFKKSVANQDKFVARMMDMFVPGRFGPS